MSRTRACNVKCLICSSCCIFHTHYKSTGAFLQRCCISVCFGSLDSSVSMDVFSSSDFCAMISNIAFTYRSIYSKKAMTNMDSTNVYAYISIIALLVCIPPAIIIEGPQLMQYGFGDAIAIVGLHKFISDLFWIGMFCHLYNQIATNTLERVAALTHAVGNVLKRVFVIGFSIVVFGVPSKDQRLDILLTLLNVTERPNTFHDVIHRENTNGGGVNEELLKITLDDFERAKTKVRPSAMREVLALLVLDRQPLAQQNRDSRPFQD